jgi:hypothetical protein
MSDKSTKTKYTSPPCPDHGYSFVAAAALFRSFGGLAVYIKYKGGDPHKITIKEQTSTHIWFVCPDREIVIVRNNDMMDAFYPYGESFDEFYDFNLFNDSVCKRLGIEYIMTNFAHSKGTVNPRTPSRIPDDQRINVLSDSGGLQMARDMIGAISPADLVEFYNQNADAGMVLDLPLSVANDEIIDRAAKLQKASTEIMLERAKGVELLNIFHGHNINQRRAYRKIVEDKRLPRCAVGGLYRQGLLGGVDIIWDLVNTGQKYKQYHMLGVFGSLHIPVLVKLANSTWKPHITSDSTSHIQSASNKAYHFQFDLYHTSKRIPIGSRGSIPNTQKLLPCQCEVCKALKYTDILAFGANRFTLELLSIHNAIEMTRYSKQLQEAADSLTSKEYNELVYTQLKSHPKLQSVKQAMDFIDVATEKGIEVARKRYRNILEITSEKPITLTNSLFPVTGETTTGDDNAGNELQTFDEKKKRVLARISAMESVVQDLNNGGDGKPKKPKKVEAQDKKAAVKDKKAGKKAKKVIKDEEVSIDSTKAVKVKGKKKVKLKKGKK